MARYMKNISLNKLNPKKHYLQVALNNTLEDAREIIFSLPKNNRIIIEAGTPFIKRYGEEGIRQIKQWYAEHLYGLPQIIETNISPFPILNLMLGINQFELKKTSLTKNTAEIFPYVVADLKTMDRGETEVEIAYRGGANAAIALGTAPIETLDSFISKCEAFGMDAMIDMMNIEFPLSILRSLKKPPAVVIIHRGVDEEKFNKEKQIPLYEIRRIKGNYNNIMISIAGGDTLREVQSSIFNDADIVVIWKSVFQKTEETITLIEGFLKEIK
jgi:bifunctional enzyme Fae/Hps